MSPARIGQNDRPHIWVRKGGARHQVCRICGAILRKDNKTSACPGRAD